MVNICVCAIGVSVHSRSHSHSRSRENHFGRLGVHAVIDVVLILAVCVAVVVDMSFRNFGAQGSVSVFVFLIC